MARYTYYNTSACGRLFDSALAKATVAIDSIEIALLLLIAFSWLVSQKRTPAPFLVVKWYNFGLTLLFWIVYSVFIFIVFFLQGCDVLGSVVDSWRLGIVSQVLYWISVAFLLATILLPICRGLARLRSPTTRGWSRAANVMVVIFTIFMIVYLGLMIWAYQSVIDSYNNYYTTRYGNKFPEYIYVYMALTTLWFLLIIAGIGKMFHGMRGVSSRVPQALKVWVFVLAFSLFAYGFLRTFFAYWNTFGAWARYYSGNYLAETVTAQVLMTLSSLVALFAITRAAQGLSTMFAHPNLYIGSDDEEVHGEYGGVVR